MEAHPARIVQPDNEAALVQTVREATGGPVRVYGSGHSFTPLAGEAQTLINLDRMSGLLGADAASQTARLLAGTKIHAIGRPLHDAGFSLKNQGDIDRQAVAGAISTGTHGTGKDLGSFAAEVVALRLVAPDGTVIPASPNEEPDIFEAARLSLGALGVLSEVTLNVRPAYKLRETTKVLPMAEILRDFDALAEKHRHVEFFWFPYAEEGVLKVLEETDDQVPPPKTSAEMAARGDVISSDQRLFRWGCEVVRFLPPLAPAANRLFTRGMTSSTRARWSHEIFASPRNVRFNEMEYSVPRAKGLGCVEEIAQMIRRRSISTAFPIEYRIVKGDEVWLSPFQGRDSATISIHEYHRKDERPLFVPAETIFRSYGGRPHWGKMHSLGARDLRQLYPAFDRFRAVRRRLDPTGKMLNRHLATLFTEDTER